MQTRATGAMYLRAFAMGKLQMLGQHRFAPLVSAARIWLSLVEAILAARKTRVSGRTGPGLSRGGCESRARTAPSADGCKSHGTWPGRWLMILASRSGESVDRRVFSSPSDLHFQADKASALQSGMTAAFTQVGIISQPSSFPSILISLPGVNRCRGGDRVAVSSSEGNRTLTAVLANQRARAGRAGPCQSQRGLRRRCRLPAASTTSTTAAAGWRLSPSASRPVSAARAQHHHHRQHHYRRRLGCLRRYNHRRQHQQLPSRPAPSSVLDESATHHPKGEQADLAKAWTRS